MWGYTKRPRCDLDLTKYKNMDILKVDFTELSNTFFQLRVGLNPGTDSEHYLLHIFPEVNIQDLFLRQTHNMINQHSKLRLC